MMTQFYSISHISIHFHYAHGTIWNNFELIMTLHYKDLCDEVGKYTLTQCATHCKKHPSPFLSQHVTTEKSSPSQISVVSPFYDRTRCHQNGPCACPYHRKNKQPPIPVNFRKNAIIRKNEAPKFFQKSKTEQNQNDQASSVKYSGHRERKNTKLILNGEKQSYNDIGHKVQCRNSDFQYFLKKNELYILTGKFSANPVKNMETVYSDQDFLEDFSSNFQIDGQMECSRQGDNKRNGGPDSRGPLRKTTKKKTMYFAKRFGEDGLISKIRRLVESILGETKKMSLSKMKKLSTVFANLVDEQKQLEGESTAYLKNKACLDKFKTYLAQQLALVDGTTHNNPKFQIQSVAKFTRASESDFRQKTKSAKGQFNRINTIGGQQQSVKIQKSDKKSPFAITHEFQCQQWERKQPNLDKKKKNSIMEDENSHINTKQQQSGQLLPVNEKNFGKGSQIHRKHTNRGKNQSAMRENYSNSKYGKDRQRDDRQHDPEGQDMKRSNLNMCHDTGNHHRRNQKQAKLEEILNYLKQDTGVDKNYMKMKKYIERNQRFIRKMEERLLDLDLGVFVIEPTDSLITRKKKIRCLREIINKHGGQTEHRGFYDQILKYLDIYTEHCDMVMKKEGRRRKDEQAYFEYLDEELIEIISSKDYGKSLKFISLHENQEFEKEKKLEWWISIPQYVTNDSTRLKKLQKLSRSVKWIEVQPKERPSQLEPISQDCLIQTELNSRCHVTRYANY